MHTMISPLYASLFVQSISHAVARNETLANRRAFFRDLAARMPPAYMSDLLASRRADRETARRLTAHLDGTALPPDTRATRVMLTTLHRRGAALSTRCLCTSCALTAECDTHMNLAINHRVTRTRRVRYSMRVVTSGAPCDACGAHYSPHGAPRVVHDPPDHL